MRAVPLMFAALLIVNPAVAQVFWADSATSPTWVEQRNEAARGLGDQTPLHEVQRWIMARHRDGPYVEIPPAKAQEFFAAHPK